MMMLQLLSIHKLDVSISALWCRHQCITYTNSPPYHYCFVLPSDNPVTSCAAAATSSGAMDSTNILNRFRDLKAIDCCVSVLEEILRDVTLNLDIFPIPPMSGVGAIKLQEGNHGIESWKRYNIVVILYHWKLKKM